jgi:hypothetical protein
VEKHINKVGIEAEFLLTKKKDLKKYVYPGEYGFSTDDFILLGEMRAEPGETRAEALANFLQVFYATKHRAEKQKLVLHVGKEFPSCVTLTPEVYAECLAKMGSKNVSTAKNIHGLNILKLTDAVTKKNTLSLGSEIIGQKISAGLHIHFSSSAVNKDKITIPYVEKIQLPLGVKGATTTLDLYTMKGESKYKMKAKVSRLTMPDALYIIRAFDDEILPKYVTKKENNNTKFRLPGWYEIKAHGFEYRSLPFSQDTLDDMWSIIDFAFTKLEGLELK